MMFLVMEKRCCEKLGTVFNNEEYLIDEPHELHGNLIWTSVTSRKCWVRDEEGVRAYDVECALRIFEAMDVGELRKLVKTVIEALNDCLELVLATSVPFLFPEYIPIALNYVSDYTLRIPIRIAWIRRDASNYIKMLLYHMLPQLCKSEVILLESPVAPTIDDIAKLCSKTCLVEPLLNGIIIMRLDT